MKRIVVAVLLGLFFSGRPVFQVASAGDAPDPVAVLKAEADKRYRERLSAYQGREHVMVLPGLVADRKARQIHIDAMSAGMGQHDPIEFLLVAPSSGNDYEALAVAFAEAGDIHKALVFIGLAPGRGVDFEKMQFWPKGERVRVALHLPKTDPVPLEHYVVDRPTKQALPALGLVFTGSRLVDDPVDAGQKRYAADIYDPRSIIAIYNEAGSVLDVPRRASQQDVYNRQFGNPDLALPTNCLLDVVMVPEYTNGAKRVVDLVLRATAEPEGQDFLLRLAAVDGTRATTGGFPAVLGEVHRLNEEGRDPFVSVEFADGLPVGTIQKICAVIAAAETEKGMRIEPPSGEHLYYRAFQPKESYRNRETRVAQPWELQLRREKETVRGTLTKTHAEWEGDSLQPQLTLTHTEIPDPAALAKALKEPGLNVLLVFVPPDLTYGELLRFVQPVRATHPLIHVFTNLPGQSADSTP